MTSACHGPNCQREFLPASWLDPWFCSYDCRSAWCLANGRNQAGEPLPGASVPAPTVTTPIVHPAGVIPPDVVQAVMEQIETRRAAMDLVQAVRDATGPQIVPVASYRRHRIDELSPPPEPEPYQALMPSRRPEFTPPPPGWLSRLLRRLFG